MHLIVENRRFLVDIVVALTVALDGVATVLEPVSHYFPIVLVKQNIVIRHLPHSHLGVEILKDYAF